jgi:hypothetical protein
VGTIEVVEAACDVTIPVARTALGGCQRTYIFRSFSESSGTPVLVIQWSDRSNSGIHLSLLIVYF